MNKLEEEAGPIEVWLRQQNILISCMIVYEDETTTEYDVDSLSMRGAQREVTGWLIREGYTPDGRWSIETPGQYEPLETWRRFKINAR